MTRGLRERVAPFVAPGPSGVTARTRLRVTGAEDLVLRGVCTYLGGLASADLADRCAVGLGHDRDAWACRKQALTAASSSRWAGAITGASNDQWALARRAQVAHARGLRAGIATIRHRLWLPVGERGTQRSPGGYRSRREWHAKTRRLAALTARLARVETDLAAGRVRVVRGGTRLAKARHNLAAAGLTEPRWRERWEAARWFCTADGEPGKRYGNETVRVTPDGQVSIRLPGPLTDLANAPHGRLVLTAPVVWHHRADEWSARIEADRAVAYTIGYDPARRRWYLTVSWQPTPAPTVPLDAALASGCVGVDFNADHLAAWRLDMHGNPVGAPRRFDLDLSGTADRRDAQARHALTRLLRRARDVGAGAIAVEDLDFAEAKSREQHGRRRSFRSVISGLPTAKLRARLVSMAAEQGVTVVAVDPAYTSRWGAQHWQRPTSTNARQTTRHEAASLVIGRRAQGLRARRRQAPPPRHRSDGVGHRTGQAAPRTDRREEPRHPDRTPGSVSVRPGGPTGRRTRGTRPPTTVRDGPPQRDSLPLSV